MGAESHWVSQKLHKLTERYHRAGKTLHLRHLSPDCRQLLSNARALIDANVEEDPLYPASGGRAGVLRTSEKTKSAALLGN